MASKSPILRLAAVPWLIFLAACSGDRVNEQLGELQEALTLNERVLGFEGSIGGGGADWTATTGTATSSTVHSEGAKSIALGGNTNPQALSTGLSALGTLTGSPSIQVQLPAGYVSQGSYFGQVALFFTCASANIFNQSIGSQNLAGPTGVFKTYTFSPLPTATATALATQNGCTASVRLSLSNSGGQAVYVDKLFLGQAGGSGGTGGVGGIGGAGGAGAGGAGAGGASSGGAGAGGQAGAGGMGGALGAGGMAGKSGAGGVGGAGSGGAGAGGAGAGGAAGSSSVEFFFKLPKNVTRETVALDAYGSTLTLGDYSKVQGSTGGWSSVSDVDNATQTTIGISAEAQSAWSQASVLMKTNSRLHGNLTSQSTITKQSGALVDGTTSPNIVLDPLQRPAWTVTFPGGSLAAQTISVNTTLPPGSYGATTVKSPAKLTLTPGQYTFSSLAVQSGATLGVNNSAGAVLAYVQSTFSWVGTVSEQDTTKNNFLLGIAGTAATTLTTSFRGVVVAPYGALTLNSCTPAHSGAFFAKQITLANNAIVKHRPLTPSNFCTVTSPVNGLCPGPVGETCDDNSDCAGGQCCGGVCGGIGCTCATNADCAPSNDCSSGLCKPHCEVFPTAPGCPLAHCVNGVKDGDETDVDCGGSCPDCGGGKKCSGNVDCATGLECGQHNGACFLGARKENRCWPIECSDGSTPPECGQPDSPCGQSCACVRSCDADEPTNTCPTGESCRRGLGTLFDAETRDVCVTDGEECPSDDPAKCGKPWSACGSHCVPKPDCSTATCAHPEDHAGGICAGVCPIVPTPGTGGAGGTTGAGGTAGTSGSASGGTSGSSGSAGTGGADDGQCVNDVQCPSGSHCLEGADGLRFCRLDVCLLRALKPPYCGSGDAPCGPCPVCTSQCGVRECGPDPSCGTSCGDCADGSRCNDGKCTGFDDDPPPTVPGDDGEVPVDELPEAQATGVAALAGGFSVSEQGTAQYTIPIDVPPGRAGIQPAISLTYSGINRAAELGVGWHIGGLSKITRCPRSQALDGYATPIKNVHSDGFCLDGQRLVATSGYYGEDGTKYHTVVDSFSQVTSRVDLAAEGIQLDPWIGGTPVARLPRDQQGPDYFEVRTRDGRILTYGRTWDSLGVGRTGLRHSWFLNDVRDRAGNSLHISYENGGNLIQPSFPDLLPSWIQPSEITYTGHGDEPGNRSVRFSYEYRPDPTLQFRQGGLVIGAAGGAPPGSIGRINAITTSIGAKAVKTYKIHYPDQPVSQIDSIQECAGAGDDPAQCKAPTKFEYIEESGFTAGMGGVDLSAATLLDADGNGRPDFLTTTVTVDGVPANPGLAAGAVVTNFVGNVGISIAVSSVVGTGLASTGVGIPAAIVFSLVNNAFWGSLADEPVIRYNTGLSLSVGPRDNLLTSVETAGLPCLTGAPMYLLDYDRDGRDDIMGYCGKAGIPGDPDTKPVLRVSLSQGNGHFTPYPSATGNVLNPYVSSELDPEVDRLPPPVLVDLDGDSLQDVVTCFDYDTMLIWRRAGVSSDFEDPTSLESAVYCHTDRPTHNILDVDGDGVADLLVRGRDSDGWQVLRYSESNPPTYASFEPVLFTDTDSTPSGSGLRLADLNGDGLIDIFKQSLRPRFPPFYLSFVDDLHIWLNTGRNAFLYKRVSHPEFDFSSDPLRRTAMVDYNADGRTDILEHFQPTDPLSGHNFVIQPNGEASAFGVQEATDVKVTTTTGAVRAGLFTVASDLDGDGNLDLFGDEGYFFGSGARNTLLSRVEDGVHKVTRVSYGGAYQADCTGPTFPETCLKTMTGLVSQHEEGFVDNDGQDVIDRVYDYTFKNARINAAGGGWLGFESRTVKETSGGTAFRTTTIEYEPPARYGRYDGVRRIDHEPGYLYPLTGLARSIVTEQVVSSSLSTIQPLEGATYNRVTRVDNHWTVKMSGSNLPFPWLESRDTSLADRPVDAPVICSPEPCPPTPPHEPVLLSTCTETFTPDPFGNTTKQTRNCPDSSSQTDTVFTPNTDVWLISNPELITIGYGRYPYAGSFQLQVWDPEYDSRGQLESLTRAPEGGPEQYHKTTYVRDDFGNPHEIIESVDSGEPPRTTTIIYDAENIYPRQVTNPLGHVTQLEYDERWGTPTTTVDPNGIVTQKSYDGLGLLSELHDPGGVTKYDYSAIEPAAADGETPVGRIQPRVAVDVSRQGTEGTTTGGMLQELDYAGRPVRTTTDGFDGVSVVEETTFDRRGRTFRRSLPHTSTSDVPFTQYYYDERDRPTEILHGTSATSGGPSEKLQYASHVTLANQYRQWFTHLNCQEADEGCPVDLVLSIDATGRKNVSITDRDGLVLRSIDGNNVDAPTLNEYSRYGHDGLGRLRFTLDNAGNLSSSNYDPYGRLKTHTDLDTGATTNTYNGFDEIATTLDNEVTYRSYTHDDLGRIKTISDNQGLTSWTYDEGPNALGRISRTTSPSGHEVAYQYEAVTAQNRGLLEKVDYTIDGVAYQVGYGYDDLGRTTRVEYPDLGGGPPIVTQYGYDAVGMLESVDEIGSGSTKPLWHLTGAFEGHLIQAENFGNGAVTTYGYNSARHWLASISTTRGSDSVQSLSYTHYANGLVENRTAGTGSSAITRTHLYDALNRLFTTTDASSGGVFASAQYGYDAIGNLTQRGSSNTTYQLAKPQLVDTVGTNQYSYFANGNLQERTGPDVPGGHQIIRYTPFDLPKSIQTGDGSTAQETTFEYAADETRVLRRDPDRVRHFVTDLYQRLIDPSSSTTLEERFRVYAGGRQLGEIVRESGSDKTLFFHTDNLGSVDTITDQTGAVTRQTFEPFGSPVDAPSTSLTRAGFTGHQHDDDLGLIDMNGRVYDPLAGRFVSADPVTQAPYWSQGINRYSYVFNDPINQTDPSGFISASDFAGLAFAAPFVGAMLSVIPGGLGSVGAGFATQGVLAATGGMPGAAQPGAATTSVATGQVQEVPIRSTGAAVLTSDVGCLINPQACIVAAGEALVAGAEAIADAAAATAAGVVERAGRTALMLSPLTLTCGDSAGCGGAEVVRIDPTRPAKDVLPGSLHREFPGQHLDKSLNQIKEALRGAKGKDAESLRKAKKLLEQSERLLGKNRGPR